MKVVFDTNIFVSALTLPGGKGGIDHLIVSRPIINELLGVMARKFQRNNEDLARIAGDAEAIVTGDRALLKLRNYRDIRIIALRHYLEG